jgi:hypothetical protein
MDKALTFLQMAMFTLENITTEEQKAMASTDGKMATLTVELLKTVVKMVRVYGKNLALIM